MIHLLIPALLLTALGVFFYFSNRRTQRELVKHKALLGWSKQLGATAMVLPDRENNMQALIALQSALTHRLDQDWNQMVVHMQEATSHIDERDLDLWLPVEDAFLDVVEALPDIQVTYDRRTVPSSRVRLQNENF
jgi:hypothetical protein